MTSDDSTGGKPAASGPEIDLDEPPLFELDTNHEPDVESHDDPDSVEGKGGADRPEGVPLPFDVLEHGNGELPDTILHRIGIGGHRLHATAAGAFAHLRALAAGAGIDLTCTDSYRTLSQQQQLKKAKPDWSATPGRSVHGWGFAVDVAIGTPPKAFGQSVLTWLKDNGPPNGWFLGRPKDEPWHWVYRGLGENLGATESAAAPASKVAAPPGPAATGAAAVSSDLDPAAMGSTQIALGATGVGPRIVRDLLGLAVGDAFDADVDVAVRGFQQANALTVDGKVGPKTWAALRSTTAPADRPALARDSTGDAVMWVQRRLGLAADGSFGPKTEAAVIAFQQATSLTTDGKVGPKTWAALTA